MPIKKKFQHVKTKWGAVDSQATHDAFGEWMGRQRADRLDHLYQNSYPSGTAYDRLMGRGATTKQVFVAKAKREGYTPAEITAYLNLPS